jgi:hypothetical protein
MRKPHKKLPKKKKLKETSKYRSKFEESIADTLSVRKIPFGYETQLVSYIVERTYKPDFILENGILIEAKGYFRSADQRKHRAIKNQHPELDIRFVFMKLSSRVQGSKMTCQEWCEKYDFLYAEKEIPKVWLRKQKTSKKK